MRPICRASFHPSGFAKGRNAGSSPSSAAFRLCPNRYGSAWECFSEPRASLSTLARRLPSAPTGESMRALKRYNVRSRHPSKRSGKRTLARALVMFAAATGHLIMPGPFTTKAQSIPPGQAATVEDLSLPLAVEIALRKNPLIRAARSGRELADAELGIARAGRFPLFQLGETFTESNNPVFVFGSLLEQGRFGQRNFDPPFLNTPAHPHPPAPIANFRTSITFRLPIFDQKQSGVRIGQARIRQQQADSQRESTEQQIRFEVVRAYYGLLVARARKEVADEAVRSAEADVKRVGDRVDTGVVVVSDRLSAEVQLAEFRQQQIQAQGEIFTAQAALNTALGIAVDTSQNVTGRLGDKSFNIGNQSDLVKAALDQRPDLARAELALKSSKEGTRGARAEYLPRFDAFGTYGVSGRNFVSGSADYAVEASAAAEAEDAANRIRFEVVRAYQEFVSARERVAVSARSVDQAGESLRIVQDRYREGLTTITEVLRA